MASSLTRSKNETLDIINVIKCVWCKGGRDTALMKLGCFHLGCRPCLERHLVNVSDGSNFHCPECDANCTKPLEGTSGFPQETLQGKVKDINDLVCNEYPNCGMCQMDGETTPSTHFCTTCKHHFCSRDGRRHPFGNNHVVVPHEELRSKEILSGILNSKSIPCTEHFSENNQQFLTIYCKKCQVSCCLQCVALKHYDHDKVTVKEAAEQYRKRLKTKAAEIGKTKPDVLKNISGLKKNLRDLQKDCDRCTTDCRKWGEDLKKTVDKIVRENVRTIENNSQRLQRNAEEGLKKEMNKMKQIENAAQYMEIVDQYDSDSEILDYFESYTKDLEKCMQYNGEYVLPAPKYVGMHANERESENCLKELYGIVYEVNDWSLKTTFNAACHKGVAFFGDDIIVVGGTNIEIYGMNGKIKRKIICRELVDATDVEVFDGEIYVADKKLRAVLVLYGDGKVNRHIKLPKEIWVDAETEVEELGLGLDRRNGDVYISSYTGHSVYKCPRGESTVTRFITTGADDAFYLCVTSNHECIVSNYHSHIVSKFSSAGEQMWVFGRRGRDIGKLLYQTGLCLDDNDHCFIADSRNHRIYHLSAENFVLSVIKVSDEMKMPIALAFANNTLVITQEDNTIHIVDCKYQLVE